VPVRHQGKPAWGVSPSEQQTYPLTSQKSLLLCNDRDSAAPGAGTGLGVPRHSHNKVQVPPTCSHTLASLVAQTRDRTCCAQTEFNSEQSKGLLFSLAKKLSASAVLLLAGYAKPPGLLLEQNFALCFRKARGDPAPGKLIWSSLGFPTDVASLPANQSLPAARQRTVEGHRCKKSRWLSCANSPGQDLPWSQPVQSRLRSRRV